ncbi:hypothetical protein BKG82_24790 [Mycobacteroides chelonae]|uniref:Uncharacterized protein n=1 Tax=Mycobacteroides chelonae TaxID=1774 RepID=A0A1S1LID7_MYCCH|nr:hypothetical protein BKG82_24790 [Mycobacteroides chelonae]
MSILDQLAEAAAPKPVKCSACEWIAKQEQPIQEGIARFLADGLAVDKVWRILRDNGMPLGNTQFRRHVERHTGE